MTSAWAAVSVCELVRAAESEPTHKKLRATMESRTMPETCKLRNNRLSTLLDPEYSIPHLSKLSELEEGKGLDDVVRRYPHNHLRKFPFFNVCGTLPLRIGTFTGELREVLPSPPTFKVSLSVGGVGPA